MVSDACPRCGYDYQIGDYPFCKGNPQDHVGGKLAIESNEQFIGGKVIENMGAEPVTVYSREEFKQQMQQRGLQQRIKWVPGDTQLINWAAGIDAQTMENARVLVERQQLAGNGKRHDPAALQSFRSSIRELAPGEVNAS